MLKKARNSKFGLKQAKLATLQKTRSNECWQFALEGVYCITRALKMIRKCFSTLQREMLCLQRVNDQLLLIHSIFCTKRDYSAVTQF